MSFSAFLLAFSSKQFMTSLIKILQVAFGMGINKPDGMLNEQVLHDHYGYFITYV